MKPLIGITSAWSYETLGDCEDWEGEYYVGKPYIEAVYNSGGLPIIIHPFFKENDLDSLIEIFDGILFSGGGRARKFAPEELPTLKGQQEDRYEFEKNLMTKAHKSRIPILGICRGYQMIVEVFGGSISNKTIRGHKQLIPRYKPFHTITINENSKLYNIINQNEWDVNSLHIQEADKIPEGFIVSAISSDSIIEGIESIDYPFLMGFQFHPEMLKLEDVKANGIFELFIDEAKSYKQIKTKNIDM